VRFVDELVLREAVILMIFNVGRARFIAWSTRTPLSPGISPSINTTSTGRRWTTHIVSVP
jgi:hypothetical protein